MRATGRRTKGVRGIRIGKTDSVIGMLVLKNDGYVLVASENGYGKRSNLEEYRTQNRSGKGSSKAYWEGKYWPPDSGTLYADTLPWICNGLPW